MSGSGEGFGPVGPAAGEGPPFAVAGPSSITLDGSRSGKASFTVSNVTGRPVRARLFVLPGTGADAAWFPPIVEAERSLPVAGTATVDVTIKVDKKAKAGSHTFALGAALEEAPDHVVSGPTVGFEVKEEKKKFPWWIIAIIVGALLILGVGAWLIYMFTRPSAPTLEQAPAVAGTVEVGSELTVEPGEWDPDDAVRVYLWQACPADATDDDDEDCEDILVGTEPDVGPAQGETYVVAPELLGMRIRVVETAVKVDPDSFGEEGPGDLSDIPHASAPSAMSEPVAPAPVTTAEVPPVEGLTFGAAQAKLSESGFQILGTTSDEEGDCSPTIEDQNPDAGAQADIGSVVAVTTKKPPPLTECWKIVTDDVLIWNEWFVEQVGP